MDDYDDQLGDPLIPTDTGASEALTQKSSFSQSVGALSSAASALVSTPV